MKGKTLALIAVISVLITTGIFAKGTLVVYSNFAVIQSSNFQKTNGMLILPTTNSAVEDSLILNVPIKWYTYHRAKKYSLAAFLNYYVGKIIEFKFQDGTVKKLKLISDDPVILQEPQSGMVFFSPSGEYIFPSLIQMDSRNYFAVSTGATEILSYHYVSTNIGWKATYMLDIDSSLLNGKVLLWNKTDTTFKNFHLFLVAGKQFENFQRTPSYSNKAVALSSENTFGSPSMKSTEGYKIYDFGKVNILRNGNDVFLSLFSKKTDIEKTNVAYNPTSDFSKAFQVVRIKHDFPIPQGTLNLYKECNGVSYYLGQSAIPDSPASSTLEVPYGENFDLQIRVVKISHIKISKDSYIDRYRVDVKNASNKEEGVWIYKYVPQSSQIMSDDLNIERVSANKIRFYVEIKPHSEGEFEYTVQSSY